MNCAFCVGRVPDEVQDAEVGQREDEQRHGRDAHQVPDGELLARAARPGAGAAGRRDRDRPAAGVSRRLPVGSAVMPDPAAGGAAATPGAG